MAHAGHRIFGSTPIPRYVQLADLFRQRVDKGIWPPGSIVPSIGQLMAEFDIARVTVRQAIAVLADEGLLSPQRGRGTFVTGKAGTRRQLRVETTLGDLVAMYRGDQPDHATLAESVTSPVLSDKDGMAAPKYFHLRRVHSRNGERYCVIAGPEGGFDDEEGELPKEAWVGRVIEVEYQSIAANGRLQFPRFVRVRDDKVRTECSVDQLAGPRLP